MICASTPAPRHPRKNRSVSARRKALIAAAVLSTLGGASGAFAADVYWDINGTTADSGVVNATPDWLNGTISSDGVWGASPPPTPPPPGPTNWNTDSTGGAGGSLVSDVGSGNTAVFSAGTDATGTYFVRMP